MFTALDWSIIVIYLLFAFAIGLLMTRKASKGLSSYFIAERSLPWWWLGTSMAATTFASDTPLAVTGIVAKAGIAGNWFLWCSILTYITMTVFFARKWRSSNVLTDVEITELRYGGRSASILRAFKAFYFSIIINSFVLGWVFRAMSKISQPFIGWDKILGAGIFGKLLEFWPGFLIFDNLNNTLTVLVIFIVVVAYSSLGGIRGVILTDLFQFVLALGCSIMFACFAVQYVGGLPEIFSKLHQLYPEKADSLLQFVPARDNPLLPFNILLIYIGVLWWAQYFSDGSGYLAQRINTARTPADAEKGALWFTLATFVLRTWPWIIVALAAMVIFPLDDPARFHSIGAEVGTDREMGYPVLMKLILPPGLLGLTFVSLLAAFMSTVDTHINWAASYLVNDVYKRFFRPMASQKQLVRVSRLSVVFISLFSVLVASQITSIEKAWKIFIALGAGMGLPQLLRWVWWRANAWTEIAGMVTAFCMSVFLYLAFPAVKDEYLLVWIVITSVLASITLTVLTKPVENEVLRQFTARVKPFGFWKEMVFEKQINLHIIKKRIIMWILGVTTTFCGMFSIGYFLRGPRLTGLICSIVSVVCFWLVIRLMSEQTNELD